MVPPVHPVEDGHAGEPDDNEQIPSDREESQASGEQYWLEGLAEGLGLMEGDNEEEPDGNEEEDIDGGAAGNGGGDADADGSNMEVARPVFHLTVEHYTYI